MRKAQRIKDNIRSATTSPWVYMGLKPQYRNAVKSGVKMIDVSEILETVGVHLGVSVIDILSPNRRRPFVDARMISIGLILMIHGYTLEKIGKLFSRDHSSIIHLRNKFNDLNEYDKEFQDKVKIIMNQIKIAEENLLKD